MEFHREDKYHPHDVAPTQTYHEAYTQSTLEALVYGVVFWTALDFFSMQASNNTPLIMAVGGGLYAISALADQWKNGIFSDSNELTFQVVQTFLATCSPGFALKSAASNFISVFNKTRSRS
jgi:hypothetical protein